MKAYITYAISALFLTSYIAADQPKCKCDKFSPCCSYTGYCGKGMNFCGIGCNQDGNFNGTKCLKPVPCKSGTFKFSDPSRVVKNTDYKGNYNKNDWIIVGGEADYRNGNIFLKANKKITGTRIEATRYIQYGKITARMKTADSPGIVSSFITMSDVKDEIDWEWVGDDSASGNGGKHEIGGNSNEDFHDYTIDWKPEGIEWLIDGKSVRWLPTSEKDGKLPNTPSRIMFSIWTTDADGVAKGTREWAGGDVNYNTQQMKENGYFDIEIESLNVQCYGEPLSTDADFKNYLNDNEGVDKEKEAKEKEEKKKENEEKRKRGEQVDDSEDGGDSTWTAPPPVATFGPRNGGSNAAGGTSDAVTNTVSYLALGLVTLLLAL
ncbi:glycoside hydrolase family 16 protein [Conidiobolus coronatus NRRL 28638]|uniref:Glycoside hydrolase family 16 protein n=1 Tax=Conidiobolus coronatus (strain ATCC 28846 / CBS 209.66 / NRRL 28638) TaxID=796925 RepID=A0A137P2K7_CONC2|nr:glycoside hydrolase family 16 protein [Conidiobolus coronatus NRRL 28638]|eukprot:KXN69149.1 glycoside hydrolase family 16 protein [Conidiobolus coronatus NRRL 28638]